MDNEDIQALVNAFPRARCLWCESLIYTKDDKVTIKCEQGLDVPCGRNFKPKKGGDPVEA